MQISLYLLSAYEEHDKMHMCRHHWNYQWRGRIGRPEATKVKIRKERFGGLIQDVDGKIYKVDFELFDLLINLPDTKKEAVLKQLLSTGVERFTLERLNNQPANHR